MDLEHFTTCDTCGEAPPSSHSVVRVLFAGRLVEAKGPGLLVRAAALLLRERTNLEFLFVGSGYLKSPLQKLAHELGIADKIHFSKGRVPHEDMPGIFASADIFAFPSIYPESFGIVSVEAMALGVPVVGFGFGGSGDFLRHLETGIVASPATPLGLASAIDLLVRCERLRRDLGQRAKLFARKQYSQDATRNVWKKIYQSLFSLN